MTLAQLRTFLAVVEAGSVRGAADRLVVSQPSVSGAVAGLDASSASSWLPARAGACGSRRLVSRWPTRCGPGSATSTSASGGPRALTSRVRGPCASPPSPPRRSACCCPSWPASAASTPVPMSSCGSGTARPCGRRCATRDADLVVAGRPPPALRTRTLGRAANHLVLVGVPASGVWPGTRRALGIVLGESTWLLREEGSGTRDATDALLANLGIDPPRMILGSNGAVEQAAIAGFGVALISMDAVTATVAAGDLVVRACPGTPLDRPWHLVARADGRLTPTAVLAARSLIEATPGFTATAEGRRLRSRPPYRTEGSKGRTGGR